MKINQQSSQPQKFTNGSNPAMGMTQTNFSSYNGN